MASPTIAVVICAYTLDRWEQLLASIESARQQQPTPSEVVVVVDHNTALAARLVEVDVPARVVESRGTPGLSGARTTGIAATGAEIVAFLDDDAQARAGWLSSLLDAYAPDVLAVGGLALPDWEGGRPGWFPDEFDWVVGCSWRGLPTDRAEVRNLLGANMSFRRQVLERIGGFDDRLGRIERRPLGGEETEICIRARRAFPTGRIVLEPAAVVDHHVPRSRQRLGYFVARCFGEGRSKALLASLSGGETVLTAERSYVWRVLPHGMMLGLHEAWHGERAGAARAVAIVLGLGTTVLGYGTARVAGLLTQVASRAGRTPHASVPPDIPAVPGGEAASADAGSP